MVKPKLKNSFVRKQKRLSEKQEIQLLESWIEFGKPDPGSNPLSSEPLPSDAPIGRLADNTFSPFVGCKKFNQLPLSQKTKDALADSKYIVTTDIQRASLPHSLCGRDILGAAKTGSGKTLAFIIPILEKLYRAQWGPQDGVGSIIITPTRELADQIFEVLRTVGKHHGFSAGLLIGGRKDVEFEKEHVNNLNILVCTPGRLLHHMDETENFECSSLQVLVLDEADRILDEGFKVKLNAILSQLPKVRQTLLFSATQTKSVTDLARLSLKDPEYLSVHKESATATPSTLKQKAMILPLDQKLDMLWSFIKAHLNSRILVFLSTCKQVKFVFEAFKKLRPGIPLKCLHGRMKQEHRMGIYSQFCEKCSVLFSTDVASRGLDFNKAVDWVVQVDCPDDVASYIHRVGRTARYQSGGKSVLFLTPSEEEMIRKLQSAKIPIQVYKAKTKRLQSVSGLVAALLVKYPDMLYLAQRAFTTYLRSIHKKKDKEVFNLLKLPIEEFSASLGLPMTPKVRFLNQKDRVKELPMETLPQPEKYAKSDAVKTPRKKAAVEKFENEEEGPGADFLVAKEMQMDGVNETENEIAVPVPRVPKKKKMKINLHKPVGTRMVFDDEGNTRTPFELLSDMKTENGHDEVKGGPKERFAKMREEMRKKDMEDKLLERQRLRENRAKKKMKLKRGRAGEEDDVSGSDRGEIETKRSKIYFDSDNDEGKLAIKADSLSLAEQEARALELLSSLNA